MTNIQTILAKKTEEERILFLKNLPTNAARSGRTESLYGCLSNFYFLAAKINTPSLDDNSPQSGLQLLIQDYNLLSSQEVLESPGYSEESEQALDLIKVALNLSSHILNEDPYQLPGQLIGRLQNFDAPEINKLLSQAKEYKDVPWLRPLIPSLTASGGASIQTLFEKEMYNCTLAITPDGERLVLGSTLAITPDVRKAVSPKNLKVLDLATGEEIHTLKAASNFLLEFWDLTTGSKIHTLSNHSERVVCGAITTDGTKAISSSHDKTIKVWDLVEGEELQSFNHPDYINAVGISPDGQRAISSSSDNTVKIWDVQKGEEIKTFTYPESVDKIITSEGNKAVLALGNTLKVLDLDVGEEIYTLTGHFNKIKAMAITPDGKRVVSADNILKVWDLATGKEIHTLAAHRNFVNSLAITSDGQKAVSASEDSTLKFWNLTTGKELYTLNGHTKSVSAVAITPDGKRAVSASADNTLKIWDLTKEDKLGVINSGHTFPITKIEISPDGKRVFSIAESILKVWDLLTEREILTLSPIKYITPNCKQGISQPENKTLKVWNLETGEETYTLAGHTDSINAIAITPNSQSLVSASSDSTLQVWDLETGEKIHTLIGHSRSVHEVVITPDGQIAVSISSDETTKVWDLETGKITYTFPFYSRQVTLMIGHWNDQIRGLAITPDGIHLMLTWNKYPKDKGWPLLEIYNLTTGEKAGFNPPHPKYISDIQEIILAPGGRFAVSIDFGFYYRTNNDERFPTGHTLNVWDCLDGQVYILNGHSDEINSIAVTSDGIRAITASKDNTLKVWDLVKREEINTLTGHTGEVKSVIITKDGQTAISASADKTIKVWDLETGEEIHNFVQTTFISTIVISPDDKTLVFALENKTIKVWDLVTGKELQTLTRQTRLLINSQAVNGFILHNQEASNFNDKSLKKVAITSDETKAVLAMTDGTLRIFDLSTENILHILDDSVETFLISPDDKYIVSAYHLNLNIWNLTTGEKLKTINDKSESVRGKTISAIAITPNGKYIVSAFRSNKKQSDRSYRKRNKKENDTKEDFLKVWNLGTGEEIYNLVGHTDSVTAVAITSNGKRVVSASDDNTVRIWDLGSGNELNEMRFKLKDKTRINAIIISPDNLKIVFAVSDNKRWFSLLDILGDGDFINDDKYKKSDGRVIIADFEGDKILHNFIAHNYLITAINLTPDAQRVVSSSLDGCLKIWDLASGQLITTLTVDSPINDCTVAQDNLTFLAGDITGKVHLMKLEGIETDSHSSDKQSNSIASDSFLNSSAKEEQIVIFAISLLILSKLPKLGLLLLQNYLLSNSKSLTISISKIATYYSAHNILKVKAIAITPDGGKAISVGMDNTLKIWDLDTINLESTMKGRTMLKGAVAVTPDGQRVVCGSGSFHYRVLEIWELETGRLLNPINERNLIAEISLVLRGIYNSLLYNLISLEKNIKLKRKEFANLWSCLSFYFREYGIIQTIFSEIPTLISINKFRRKKNHESKKSEKRLSTLRRYFFNFFMICFGVLVIVILPLLIPLVILLLVPISWFRNKKIYFPSKKQLIIFTEGVNLFTKLLFSSIISGLSLLLFKLQLRPLNVKSLNQGLFWLTAVAITPDGQRAVSASLDKTIKVWNLDTGEVLYTYSSHQYIHALAITSDGEWAVLASRDNYLKVLNLSTGEIVSSVYISDGSVHALAITPDKQQVIFTKSTDDYWREYVCDYINLYNWNLITGNIEYISLITTENPKFVALATDGKRVFISKEKKYSSIEENSQLETINLAKNTNDSYYSSRLTSKNINFKLSPGIMKPKIGWITAIALGLNNRRLVAAGASIKIWDLAKTNNSVETNFQKEMMKGIAQALLGTDIHSTPEFLGDSSSVKALALTLDGNRVRFIHSEKSGLSRLKIWDTVTERINFISLVSSNDFAMEAIAITPDGKRAVSASTDNAIEVWDLATGLVQWTLCGHCEVVSVIIITPDGNQFVSGSKDRTIKVWDLNTGKIIKTFFRYIGSVTTLAMIPNTQQIVFADYARSGHNLKILDLITGEIVFTFPEEHTDIVNQIAIFPSGRVAVSVSKDKTLKVWNLEEGKMITKFTDRSALNCCALAPDEKTIIVGNTSGDLHFLKLKEESLN